MAATFDGSTLQGKEREEYVRKLFNEIAEPYDRLNRIISLGRDLAWRRRALDWAELGEGISAVDLGTGTGDFFLLLHERAGANGSVIGLDLAEQMLTVAREKAAAALGEQEFDLRVASAADTGLPSASADVVTMGWVLRNVGDRAAVYREVLRILRPGGKFLCIDMSQPDFAPLRWAAAVYLRLVMPGVIRLCGGDLEAYRYLARSTTRFPRKGELADEWRQAGFEEVRVRSFMLGQIGVHLGQKGA